MRRIRYANRTVALGGDDVLLAPEIAALEADHPTKRFVSMQRARPTSISRSASGSARRRMWRTWRTPPLWPTWILCSARVSEHHPGWVMRRVPRGQ
jgi:hypothetical protein